MEEKDQKTEMAEQPADKPEQIVLERQEDKNIERMMQMINRMYPDNHEQREKEYWRNLHKELIFHYEIALKENQGDFNELISNAITYARFVMNEIQAYERGDYKEMFQQK